MTKINQMKPRESTCCFHIGLPKTGTTTLQTSLLPRHSQVDYLGRHGRTRQITEPRHRIVKDLVDRLTRSRPSSPELQRCRDLFRHRVEPTFVEGKVPVGSWEHLADGPASRRLACANSLREVFGHCQIIVTVRHPVRLIESLYFQSLKRINVGKDAVFGSPPRYYGLEHKLQSLARRRSRPRLEYAKTIRIYADVFGKQSVKVFLFEQLVENQPAFIAEMCRFLGIDECEGNQLASDQHANQRWKCENIDRLRSVRDSSLRSLLFRIGGRYVRRKMLGLTSDSTSDRARAQVSRQWQDRIAEWCAPGNRWLVDNWNLPMARYGYPL